MKAYARDFRAIAAALKDTGASLETVKAIASVLAGSNGAFDRERFITATMWTREDFEQGERDRWAQIEAMRATTLPLTDTDRDALCA